MLLSGSSFAGRRASHRARRGALALLLATVAVAVPAAGVLAASSTVSSPEVTTVVSGPDKAVEGSLYLLTITVTNTSGRDMIGSGLFAVIPNGTAARIKDVAGGTCRIDRNIQATCQGGALAAGASTSVVVDIIPQSSGPMTLTAWGSVETGGIVWIGSGSTSITVNVDPAPVAPAPAPTADLGLNGTSSVGAPAPGSTFTTTYTVKNAGPSTSSAVRLVQTLPAGFTYAGSTGGCSAADGTVTCDLGDVANGSKATVGIDLVAPTTTGKGSIAATVSAATQDTKTGNNSTSISVSVK